jgi:hypothetical protein
MRKTVWSGSTTLRVKTAPLPRQNVSVWYSQLRSWRPRVQGITWRAVSAVYRTLGFHYLDHETGRCEPSQAALARSSGYSLRTVKLALMTLRNLGVVSWQRRCEGIKDADGRFALRQLTNAYGLSPPSQWRGYPTCPLPEAGTWGDHPPLPSGLDNAAALIAMGADPLGVLAADPSDKLSAALAGLGRALTGVRRAPRDQNELDISEQPPPGLTFTDLKEWHMRRLFDAGGSG